MLENDANARTWGMLCHLSALSGYFVPLGWLLGPLIIWLVKRNEIPFVEDQGKESVNFQLTMLIAWVIVFIVTLVTCGIGAVLAIPVIVIDIVFPIIAAVQANNGVSYRYPFTIRFIQ